MRITIFGAGGVGGLFGSFLAKAGRAVEFIARGEQYKAPSQTGLKVTTPHGDFEIPTVSVFSSTEMLKKSKGFSELILVCVKTWHIEQSIEPLKSIVGPKTILLPLSNGLVSTQTLIHTFGKEKVVPGLCYGHYWMESPGKVLHIGPLAKIVFGELDSSLSERSQQILEVLSVPGIEVMIAESIEVEQWKKFIVIASLGPLTSICKISVDRLMKFQGMRMLLEQGMREVQALAMAKGILIPENTLSNALTLLDKGSSGATTSMQRDFLNNQPTELEAFSGYIIREAEKHAVSVPFHQWCYESLA